jgi:hypothetical protein
MKAWRSLSISMGSTDPTNVTAWCRPGEEGPLEVVEVSSDDINIVGGGLAFFALF